MFKVPKHASIFADCIKWNWLLDVNKFSVHLRQFIAADGGWIVRKEKHQLHWPLDRVI